LRKEPLSSPPPNTVEPAFARLSVSGGLSKNLDQPSVNTFSEEFLRNFRKRSDGKNRRFLLPRTSSHPSFDRCFVLGGLNKNFAAASVNIFSELFSGKFRIKLMKELRAFALPRDLTAEDFR
jgi:hypothetical protein